jgi:MFS superfamily sulfate permease-like transporter
MLTVSQDNLVGPRRLFGVTLPIARASALVLHVDVSLILLRAFYRAITFSLFTNCENSCLSQSDFHGTPNSAKRDHSIW